MGLTAYRYTRNSADSTVFTEARSLRKFGQQLRDDGAHELNGLVGHSDENVAASQVLLIRSEPFAQHAADPIPIHGARHDAPRNDHAEARAIERIEARLHPNARAPQALARREQRVDILAAESLFAGIAPRAAQTTPRRARPFARRARITARPPRVRIRTRNPCVRFRRSTEG